jgi:hypothetical protein
MKHSLKRLLSMLLVLAMVLALVPTVAFAATTKEATDPASAKEISSEAIETVNNDVWASIDALEDKEIIAKRGTTATAEDYQAIAGDVAKVVESSETYKDGTCTYDADSGNSFFTWETTEGVVCGYSPRLRAEIRANEVAGADAEALSGVETVSYAKKGGSPTSTNIALIEPYYGLDSSFTSQYQTEANSLATKTGGTYSLYKTTAATIDVIATALQNSGIVIFDSHGTTDYESGSDYTSQANSSYLCIQTGTGLTTADQASVTGTYGSYYHAFNGGSNGSMNYYCVDGTAIANHMTGTAPNSLLWMAICLGMATDGIEAPMRNKGVEVVYGYSQSTSFTGDYKYEASFFTKIKSGETVATAAAYMKSANNCNWDPAYSSYTLAQAKSNYCAFPIFVSDEDTYPGHGNVDAVQTALSTWTLSSASAYTVTAASNNTSYGTVAVSGSTITATPASGYYAAGYTVSSGTATVTQSGNTFTVSASSNCTITINFAAKTTTSISYSENGTVTSTATPYLGDAVTLPAATVTPTGYTFVGWTTGAVTATTTKPTVYAAGASYTVSAATTLYAVYSYSEAGTGTSVYTLVTDAANLTTGSNVVIAASGYDYAIGTTQNSNNRAQVAVTKDTTANTLSFTGSVAEFTLGAGSTTGTYSFYDSTNSGYLYAASSSGNYLRTETTLSANSSWTITIASGVATIVANGSNTQIHAVQCNEQPVLLLQQRNSLRNRWRCIRRAPAPRPITPRPYRARPARMRI